MAGVRGQVEELVLATEHDLDLLDAAPVAFEAVVDAAADEPRPELGECPVERRALADRGVPVLEGDVVSGSSWRLETASFASRPSVTSSVPAISD